MMVSEISAQLKSRLAFSSGATHRTSWQRSREYFYLGMVFRRDTPRGRSLSNTSDRLSSRSATDARSQVSRKVLCTYPSLATRKEWKRYIVAAFGGLPAFIERLDSLLGLAANLPEHLRLLALSSCLFLRQTPQIYTRHPRELDSWIKPISTHSIQENALLHTFLCPDLIMVTVSLVSSSPAHCY